MSGFDADTRRLWERHRRVFAQRCARIDDGFACCPAYDRRYPSSAGITVRQAHARLSETIKIHQANMVYTKTLRMPDAEAQAMAMPIPKLAVGEYGYLVSVRIDEILGPEEMIVSEPWLIDAARVNRDYRADRARARQAEDEDAAEAWVERIYEQRFALVDKQKDKHFTKATIRLVGFPTAGLSPDARWLGPADKGIQLFITGTETYGSERRPRTRFVAVALNKVRFGLDEAGFIELLETRGLTPASFIELVMDRMSEHDPDTARKMVFQALLTPVNPDTGKVDKTEN